MSYGKFQIYGFFYLWSNSYRTICPYVLIIWLERIEGACASRKHDIELASVLFVLVRWARVWVFEVLNACNNLPALRFKLIHVIKRVPCWYSRFDMICTTMLHVLKFGENMTHNIYLQYIDDFINHKKALVREIFLVGRLWPVIIHHQYNSYWRPGSTRQRKSLPPLADLGVIPHIRHF